MAVWSELCFLQAVGAPVLGPLPTRGPSWDESQFRVDFFFFKPRTWSELLELKVCVRAKFQGSSRECRDINLALL